MSKLYKGIIFNSTTVRALRGQFADTVRKNHIRTAVVSNHGKTEVQEALDATGIHSLPRRRFATSALPATL